MEWSFYAEVLGTIEPKAPLDNKPAELKFASATCRRAIPRYRRPRRFRYGRRFAATCVVGVTAVSSSGRGDAAKDPAPAALDGVNPISRAVSNNDGFADLCVLTGSGPGPAAQRQGRLARTAVQLPAGRFRKTRSGSTSTTLQALDLFLLGASLPWCATRVRAISLTAPRTSVRIQAPVGGVAVPARAGQQRAMDLAVSYRDRPGVYCIDKLAGRTGAAAGCAARRRTPTAGGGPEQR